MFVQAQAKQRSGRAGRTGPGKCYRYNKCYCMLCSDTFNGRLCNMLCVWLFVMTTTTVINCGVIPPVLLWCCNCVYVCVCAVTYTFYWSDTAYSCLSVSCWKVLVSMVCPLYLALVVYNYLHSIVAYRMLYVHAVVVIKTNQAYYLLSNIPIS